MSLPDRHWRTSLHKWRIAGQFSGENSLRKTVVTCLSLTHVVWVLLRDSLFYLAVLSAYGIPNSPWSDESCAYHAHWGRRLLYDMKQPELENAVNWLRKEGHKEGREGWLALSLVVYFVFTEIFAKNGNNFIDLPILINFNCLCLDFILHSLEASIDITLQVLLDVLLYFPRHVVEIGLLLKAFRK